MTQNKRHRITRIVVTTCIFICFGMMFYPFWTPLLLAALFAFGLEPMMSRISSLLGKRRLTTFILLFSFVVLSTLMAALILWRIIVKASEYSKQGFDKTKLYISIQHFLETSTKYLHSISQRYDISPDSLPDLSAMIGDLGKKFIELMTAFAGGLPVFILNFFVFTLALYFFLTQAKRIKAAIGGLDLLTLDQLDQLVTAVQNSSYRSLVTTTLIGLIQASVVSVFAWGCGYTEFLVIFVGTFFCSMIPIIGAGPVAFILAVLSFAQEQYTEVIVLILATLIAGSIDNILRPFLVAGTESKIHSAVSLVALVGAIMFYGMPGLLLGPILLELAFVVVPILYSSKMTNE